MQRAKNRGTTSIWCESILTDGGGESAYRRSL